MSAVVDLLDEDKPIAEQKYVCLSFISPENIIKQKELFFFEKFTKQYHFNKTAELLTQYSNYISFKVTRTFKRYLSRKNRGIV